MNAWKVLWAVLLVVAVVLSIANVVGPQSTAVAILLGAIIGALIWVRFFRIRVQR